MHKADGLLGHSLRQMGRKKGVQAGEIPSASGEWRLEREEGEGGGSSGRGERGWWHMSHRESKASSWPGRSVDLRLAAWGLPCLSWCPQEVRVQDPSQQRAWGSLGAWFTSAETPSGDPRRRDQDAGSQVLQLGQRRESAPGSVIPFMPYVAVVTCGWGLQAKHTIVILSFLHYFGLARETCDGSIAMVIM